MGVSRNELAAKDDVVSARPEAVQSCAHNESGVLSRQMERSWLTEGIRYEVVS